mmetsp:Transcript_8005/g.23628  ORF Transcript_8005/g.23628 Transcript_8005/m.23628 type:complete len:203 (+) Transcript_8005:1525-2133(+)
MSSLGAYREPRLGLCFMLYLQACRNGFKRAPDLNVLSYAGIITCSVTLSSTPMRSMSKCSPKYRHNSIAAKVGLKRMKLDRAMGRQMLCAYCDQPMDLSPIPIICPLALHVVSVASSISKATRAGILSSCLFAPEPIVVNENASDLSGFAVKSALLSARTNTAYPRKSNMLANWCAGEPVSFSPLTNTEETCCCSLNFSRFP